MYFRIVLFLFSVSTHYKGVTQILPVQTVRGTVSDKSIKTILSGATIDLFGTEKRTVIADANGNFLLPNVPVGRHDLRITYIGYKPFSLNNLLIE